MDLDRRAIDSVHKDLSEYRRVTKLSPLPSPNFLGKQ
jgi:hypothetical protein